jgi:hypothetical protein
MTDQNKPEQSRQQVAEDRRAFLARAGKSAVAAPAAALLLAATAAKGQIAPSGLVSR